MNARQMRYSQDFGNGSAICTIFVRRDLDLFRALYSSSPVSMTILSVKTRFLCGSSFDVLKLLRLEFRMLFRSHFVLLKFFNVISGPMFHIFGVNVGMLLGGDAMELLEKLRHGREGFKNLRVLSAMFPTGTTCGLWYCNFISCLHCQILDCAADRARYS